MFEKISRHFFLGLTKLVNRRYRRTVERPRDIEGPSKDGGYESELDRSSRRGERASRYVKGRSKYRANWHDSHTSVGFLACEKMEEGERKRSVQKRSRRIL